MTDSVTRIFSETFGINPGEVTDELSPANFPKWDSLKSILLMALLQKAFSVEFSASEIIAMRSVGLIRRVLRRKGLS